MKKLLLILLCVPLIGFGQTEYKKLYHDNGQLMVEGNIKDGKKDSIWKWYDEKGQLQAEVTYKDGKEEGWYKWFENGKLKYEGNIKDGEENGIWKNYHENGQVSSEQIFKDGVNDGLAIWYYEDGQLQMKGYLKGNVFSSEPICWDREGNKIKCE